MSAWNTEGGSSVHAKALVYAWQNAGHKVTVFSFIKNETSSNIFTQKDEKFVIRCFGKEGSSFFDPRPILTTDFDIFLVEDIRTLPKEELIKVFYLIRHRSRVVHVVHENSLPKEAWFYQFVWDKIVYFDKRQEFLKEVYPDAEFIPFPCLPPRYGNKEKSRKRLGLPQDKKIILCFCHQGYEPYFRDITKELRQEAVLLFLIPPGYEMLEKEGAPSHIIIREEPPLSIERLDDYLFASDAAIFHKFHSRYHRIASSLIFQVLGARCPILVPRESDFFKPLTDEVIYYKDIESINQSLINLFRDEEKRERLVEHAEVFAKMHSADKIAERYIETFTKILRRRLL
jgi:glycosyltransferase involved in cell wall biosynthesis